MGHGWPSIGARASAGDSYHCRPDSRALRLADMERTGTIGAFRTTLGLLVAGPLLAVLVVSRALPPAELADVGMSWVLVTLAGLLTLVASVAAIGSLVSGIRTGSLSALLAAGASSALAGGAVATLSGAAALLPIVLAAAALLAGAIADRYRLTVTGRTARAAVAASVLVLVEIGVVAEVAPATSGLLDAVGTPLAVLGVALAVGAAIVALGHGAGSVATALLPAIVAIAIGREASLETVVALVALVGSQVVAVVVATTVTGAADEPPPDRLPELTAGLADAILRFDGRLRLRDWNPAAATLLGLDGASAGAHLEDLLGVALADLPLPGGAVSTVSGVGGLRIGLQRSGEGITAVIRVPEASPESERLARELRGTIEELLQARRTIDLQRQELERASSIDALTGVASRAAILERLRLEIAQARRYEHPVAVVLLDLDGFAAVNRLHGTAGGDAVLREAALRIRLRVREADELGRIGSDAFLTVLPHTEEAGAATFADALQHRLGLRPIAVGDDLLILTASVGVAVIRPGDELDVDTLLARVDEALASAKRAGGNRIALDRLHGLARLDDHRPAAPEEVDEGRSPG